MPILVGLGVGALSYESQQAQSNKQRMLAAQTQKYSPWTGNKAVAPTDPNAVTDIAQGGVSGAMMGQQMQNAKATQGLQQAQTNWLNQGYSPYNGGMYGGGAADPTMQAQYVAQGGNMLGTSFGNSYGHNPFELSGTGQ